MSTSRTYIGPFGRILPVPDGFEPEREILPCDETRTNMTTYSLPPPDRLQFGSDTSPGFTDPTRYNTISHAARTNEPVNATYRDIARQAHHDHLPSLRHMLTPAPQSSTISLPSPKSPRQDESRPSFSSNHPSAIVEQNIQPTRYSPYQASFIQSQLPVQAQQSENLHPQRDSYHHSTTLQPLPPSYAPPTQASLPQPYPPQQQNMAAPSAFQPQQMIPADLPHPPQILPVNFASQFYPDHRGSYDPAMSAITGIEPSEATATNQIKPLPRVIGEGDVPGEGPSWFYEDGTTCKKIIDGEAVNAQWGVTKAGKPRKRLAIACTTCREKKIKCDPAEPKCVQCEKFGRECRFTTAFRNQHNSSESPSYESQARTPSINIKIEPNTRRILPSLSTSSSAEAPAPDRLPSLTSASSIEDSEAHKGLKRRKSSPDGSYVQPALSNDLPMSNHRLPAIKKQHSGMPSPIAPTKAHDKASSKTYDSKVSLYKPHDRPWEEPLDAKDDESVHWTEDSCEIDAKAGSHYLGMHRNICGTHLTSSTIAYRVKDAIDHAHQLLQVVKAIAESPLPKRDLVSNLSTNQFAFSSPFVGYAILTALDCLTAAGSVEFYEDTMTIMGQSLAVVEKLSQVWASAKGQSQLIRRRIQTLMDAVNSKQSHDKSAWKCRYPLDPSLGQGYDVFYDSQDVLGTKLFEYLGIKVREDEILLVCDT